MLRAKTNISNKDGLLIEKDTEFEESELTKEATAHLLKANAIEKVKKAETQSSQQTDDKGNQQKADDTKDKK